MQYLHRVAAVTLALALAFALCACGKKPPEATSVAMLSAKQGENLATMFFTYSVTSVERLQDYMDYFPEEDKALVLVKLTVQNTTNEQQTMYDSDFVLRWAEGEEGFAWMRDAMDETMYPPQFALAPQQSGTYGMLFVVPKEQTNFTLEYSEQYAAQDGQQQTGKTYQTVLTLASTK